MKNKKYEEDINLLEQIADLASKKNLTDIEFKKKFKEDTEISIKISNTSKNLVYEKTKIDKVVNSQIEPPENISSSYDDEINEKKNQPGIISSPMVGTVYLSPEPGVDPFIKVGQNVNIGDTLFIGPRVEFEGIPCFSPEIFSWLRNPNPSAFKIVADIKRTL